MNYFEGIGFDFLGRIPYLVAWIVAVVFAVLMIKRSGGRAEKFLMAGCSLMFFVQLLTPFLSNLTRWAISEQGRPIATIGIIYSLPVSIISLAGIVCLVYAFWVRFKKKNYDTGGSQPS